MAIDTSENEQIQDLEAVLEIIAELARKSHGKNYIYRGENKPHLRVSSSLYRRYEDIEADSFDIEVVQVEILDRAKSYTRYTGENGENEILSQLQHNGGETNLIDFTTDYLIALFFACDGAPEEAGRIIMLTENGEGYTITEPSHPSHRVIAQKSVFVRPSLGYVEPDDVLTICSHLKPMTLDYLRNNHGITTETVYNDLHGFIRHHRVHQSAYVEFHKGVTSIGKGDYFQAIEDFTRALDLNSQLFIAHVNRGISYTRLGNYVAAIKDYESALDMRPEDPRIYNSMGYTRLRMGNYHVANQLYSKAIEFGQDAMYYCNRGESWIHLGEWDKARKDFQTAKDKDSGYDIVESFHHVYENVEEFEQQTNLKLPTDLALLLGG